MNVFELLDELHELDISLGTRGDSLTYDAPQGALTPRLRLALAANKPAILNHLSEFKVPVKRLEGGTLSELFTERALVVVKSGVLGENVLFAADDAEIPSDNHLVVYREAELRELVGKTPEQLRKIHEVKTEIDSEILSRYV